MKLQLILTNFQKAETEQGKEKIIQLLTILAAMSEQTPSILQRPLPTGIYGYILIFIIFGNLFFGTYFPANFPGGNVSGRIFHGRNCAGRFCLAGT